MDLDDYTPEPMTLEEAWEYYRSQWDGNPETEPLELLEIAEAILMRDGLI